MITEKMDQEFLLLSLKFCDKVNKYISLLSLNEVDVEELKNDTLLFAYVVTNLDHYSTCIDSFTKHRMQNMRLAFSHLAQSCKNSKNYTVQIGIELGIEIPVYAFLAN